MLAPERIQTPLPLLLTASCPEPLSAKTPLIVFAPVLAPLSVSVVTPLVAAGVIPPPKLSVRGTAAGAAGECGGSLPAPAGH